MADDLAWPPGATDQSIKALRSLRVLRARFPHSWVRSDTQACWQLHSATPELLLRTPSPCTPLPKEYRPALMSTEFPLRPEVLNEAVRIAIVASEYNRSYVDGLVRFASEELAAIAPQAKLSNVRVPGSFEIPIAVQAVAKYHKPDAILAFGLIF